MKYENPLTVNINLNDETGVSVNVSRTYEDDVQWTALMNQFIDTLRAYGYILPPRTVIELDEDGLVTRKFY